MPTPLTLNLVEGSVVFSFSPAAARELHAALAELLTRLKLAAAGPAGRGAPQASLEYRHQGEVFLEVFCNPNLWASPFAARVLLTVRDDRLRLTTEADLTRVMEDVSLYLETYG